MKFLDLEAQYRSIKKEIDEAVLKVAGSGMYVGEKEVEGFEKEIARYCKTSHAIGVNSGTDALLLSLKALGIGEGDEVITTPFSFIATASVIAHARAKPVFVDIDPETFNIDASQIERKITKKTKAIIPVHLFGQMADMSAIMKIARRHKLFVVEDAAQAIGAEWKGRKAGSVGDMGCLSFFPTKNLGAYGDGGLVLTNNKKLAEKVRLLKDHGASPRERYLHIMLGFNSRLDAIQAAVLRVKLKHLSKWNRARVQKARAYSSQLKGIHGIELPCRRESEGRVFHQYTIRVKGGKRSKLQAYLKERGIPTMVYYPRPIHLQPIFRPLRYKKGDFPEAERAAREVLSLPIDPTLSSQDQKAVVEQIKRFFA